LAEHLLLHLSFVHCSLLIVHKQDIFPLVDGVVKQRIVVKIDV
jgi:hypothetical protein